MGRWGWAIAAGALACAALMWAIAVGGAPGGGADQPQAVSRESAAEASAPSKPDLDAQPEALASLSAVDVSAVEASLAGAAVHDPAIPDGLEHITVTGRVLDPEGRPIPAASLTLLPDDTTYAAFTRTAARAGVEKAPLEASAETDALGRFEVRGPWFPDGGFRGNERHPFPRLRVHARGYVPLSFECSGFSGGSYDLGDLRLTQLGAALRVSVVDPAGAPLEGVRLSARAWSIPKELEAAGWTRESSVIPDRVSDVHGLIEARDLLPVKTLPALAGDGVLRRDLEWVQLVAGETLDLGEVVLEWGPRFHGAVRDQDGAPIEGARVVVTYASGEGTRKPDESLAELAFALAARERDAGLGATTDANGRYEVGLRWVSDQPVVIYASAAGFEPTLIEGFDSAGGVADLVLRPEARLRVLARDRRTGLEVVPTTLRAFRRSDRWRHNRLVSSELQVTGNVVHQAGSITTLLFVEASGFEQRLQEVGPVAPGESAEVVVELDPARTIELRVRDELGEPVAGVEVFLRPGESWEQALRYRNSSVRRNGSTDALGVLRLDGLASGTWHFSVVSRDHVDLNDELVVPESGDSVHDVVLARSATVRGRVLTAEGAPAVAQLVLLSRGDTWHELLTDVAGRFEFVSVEPGAWSLTGALVAPSPLELRAAETYDVELQQGAPLVVQGVVLVDGVPAEAGLRVGINGPEDNEFPYDSSRSDTDAAGRFRFELPYPGEYYIEAWREGLFGSERKLHAAPGESIELTLELASGTAVLAGTLVSAQATLPFETLHLSLSRDGASAGWLRPSADGSFRKEGLPAGSYRISLRGGVVVEAEFGPFELSGDSVLDELELPVVAGATVHGHIRESAAKPFAGLVLLHDLEGGARFRYDWLSSGDFRIDGLPAGMWQLSLTDGSVNAREAGEGSVEYPLFAREIVTLEPGETRELDLVLPGSPPD